MSIAAIYSRSLIVNIATVISGFVTSVLLARMLDPTGRGEVAALLFIASLTSSLASVAISPQAIIKYISDLNNRQFLRSVDTLVLILSCSTIIIAPIIYIALGSEIEVSPILGIPIVLCIASCQVLNNGFAAIARARGQFDFVTLSIGFSSIVYLVLILLVFHSDQPSAWVVTSVSLPPVFMSAVGLIAIAKGNFRWRQLEIKSCLSYARQFIPISLISLSISSIDRALLLDQSTLRELGFYVVAASLTAPMLIAVETIVQISFVEVAATRSRTHAVPLAMRRFRLGQAFIILMGVGLLLLGPAIITLCFGTDYREAIPIFWWLLAATSMKSLSNLLDHSIRGLGQTNWALGSMVAGAGVMCIMGFALIPGSGAIGAAQASFLAALTSLLVLLVAWRYLFHIRWPEFSVLNHTNALEIADALRRARSSGK